MADQASSPSQIIALPKGGGAQRGLGEKFAPDLHTGTGNFTVPIAVPPGRNGLQPQLNLVYSSGHGNGLHGTGWALDIAGVTRKTSRGIPRYRDYDLDPATRDVFILSGAEDLVPVPDASLDPSLATRYRPRSEGLFASIVHHHDAVAGMNYWEVSSIDGLTSYYGPNPTDQASYHLDFTPRTTPATIARPKSSAKDPDRFFAWKLTLTKDPFGNRIEYLYEDRDAGQSAQDGHAWDQPLLTQIRYADYDDGAGLKFLVSITFAYEDGRDDPHSDYRAGFEIRTTKRCKSILVETHADTKRPVREYRLGYRSDVYNGVSLLESIALVGFDDQGKPYDGVAGERQLPTLTFQYTQFDPEKRKFQALASADLPPLSIANATMELVDLHGAGLPDVLQMNGRAVRYWRNLGDGRFDMSRPMRDAPAGTTFAMPGVQLLDANGDGCADLMVTNGPLAGYFPLEFPAKWSPASFQRYRYRPSFNLEDPEVKLIDLTGDGVTDVLRSSTRMECFFNDPDAGWTPGNTRWVEREPLQDFPDVKFSDPRVKVADMTGDGMQDVVLVHSGSFVYWPNQGYGSWAKRVRMKNSPTFPSGYDPRRILLGDVDGDGVCDLVYVDDREIQLWINRSGNAWFGPIVIEGTPPVTDNDALRFADILGTGISGILWSTDVGGLGPRNFMFLDFTGGTKPYLLNRMDNRLGATTDVEYKPSTWFYLQDAKSAATRWRTTLPFPVHVVSKVTIRDALSDGRLTTEYRYHHGHWDGVEREFRGFGRVEHLDLETFPSAAHGAGAVEDVHYSPPTLTKTWFHLGPVGPEFGAWQDDLDWSNEFWPGDPVILDHTQFVTPFLRSLAGNDPASRRVRRDAVRTLRGSIIRTELYAIDGSPDESRPYTVTESQYDLREIDPPAPAELPRQRIFFPHLRGQRTTQWERGDDPLTVFAFTDDYDAFGQPTRSASIACPRGWRNMEDQPAAAYLATQSVTTYAAPWPAGPYIHNRIAVSTSYEMPGTFGKRVGDLRASDASEPANVIAQTLNYYDGAAFAGLSGANFAKVGSYGALTRTEQLVFTDQHLANALQGTGVSTPPWLTRQNATWGAEYPAAFRQAVPILGSFAYNDGSDGWHVAGYFAATQRRAYDVQLGTGTRGLVATQRDPLGRDSTITYDSYDLLPLKVTDPLKLEVSTTPNYRVLQPEVVTDSNGNASRVHYDPIGLVDQIWVQGKSGAEGDAQQPSVEMSYDFLAFERSGQPICVRTLRHERHDTDPDYTASATIEAREYSDGFGRLLQTRTQADDVLFGDATFGADVLPLDPATAPAPIPARQRAAGDPPNVVVSGWQVYDNKGRVVEKYEPYFDRGWDYVAPAASQLGAKVTMYYDPRGQVIRSINPDGSELRVIHGIPIAIEDPPQTPADTEKFYSTPWEAYTYDANDNAGLTHAGVAQGYRHHWDTPASIVVDALGRTVEAVARNRNAPDDAIQEYRTRTAYDIRGNVIAIVDALGRQAFRHVFDLANRRLRLDSVDAGLRLTLFDAAGNLVEARDRKGALTLHAYDDDSRPTRMWARDDGTESVTLRERLDYGDQLSDQMDAASRNVRGRPVVHADEAGQLVLERYDFKGNLLEKVRKVIDPGQLADPLFLVNWETGSEPALSADEYRTSSSYDALNRIVSVQYPLDVDGERKLLQPTYNRAGALESVELDGAVFVDRIAYDAKGQRTVVVYGNGLLTACAYDRDTFRLERMWTGAFTPGPGAGYQPTGTPLQNLGYAYDLVGNITAIVEVVPGCGVTNNGNAAAYPALAAKLASGDALVREFSYDAIYRLAAATGREASNIQGLPPWADTFHPEGYNWGTSAVPNPGNAKDLTRVYRETYTYDPAGNMMKLWHGSGGTQRRRNFGMAGFTPAQWRSKVQALLGGGAPDWGTDGNRLTNFGTDTVGVTHQFDANGNMIAEFANRSFAWDHADRLRSFGETDGAGNATKQARYLYDSAGQRVMKRVETSAGVEVTVYVGRLFEHRLFAAGQNNTLHVMDDRSRIAMLRVGAPLNGDMGPAVQYQLGDHLGSAALVVGGDDAAAKDFQNREELYPYGETSFGSFAKKKYRLSGKERDEESNISYFGARYYSPSLVRWTSCDPIRPGPNCTPYCPFANSPISHIDDDGMQANNLESNDVNGVPLADRPTTPSGTSLFHYDPVGGAVEGEEDSFEDNCFKNTFIESFTRKDLFMLGGMLYGLAQSVVPGGALAPSPATLFSDSFDAGMFELSRGLTLQFAGIALMISGSAGQGFGTGMTLTGVGAEVGIPALAISSGAVETGALDLAVGLSVSAKAAAALSKASSGFGRKFREDERDFMRPEDRIDMKDAPESSSRTAEDYKRNSRWYFRKLLEKHAEYFSEENEARILNDKSPIIDQQWLEYHEEHRWFEGDFLRHHHIDRGSIAVAIPRRFHEIFHSMLHYFD